MFREENSIKLSRYFEIKKAQYTTIQLIPTKSNRNNTTSNIALLINKMFLNLNDIVRIENKKLIITTNMKASYYIHITKEETQFFFVVPNIHLNTFKTKFAATWRNVELKEVEGLPIDINKHCKYQLRYKYNDVLSLDVDKRSNDLLNANMSILEVLETNESVGILYNFIPTGERAINYFRILYKDMITRYKNGENLKKNKNIWDLFIIAVKFILGIVDDLLSSLQNDIQKSNAMGIKKKISSSTERKYDKDICQTQIIVVAKSDSKEKENSLCKNMCNTFKAISDDNELNYKRIKKDININQVQINNVSINNTSIDECNNFLALPGTDLINQYKNISHNKILETQVPECLKDGEIRIGNVKYKDKYQEAYYSMDEQIKRMGRVLLGSQGAGKDYYMCNLAKDIIKAGRGLIVIDYIDKCQLANNIKSITPKNKLLEIDCTNISQLQAFAYNELKVNDHDLIEDKIAIAMQIAEQLQLLLDSINDNNSQLTPRMLRYLYAAATVVYYKDINSSFKHVMDILTTPEKRMKLIFSLNEDEQKFLVDEIDDLKELNKKIDKNGVIENYDSKVDGIVDRISWLKTNMYTKIAFSKDSSTNIDFVDAINENKVILIKIPEKKFKSKMIRNVLATFFLNKVWLAKQEGATDVCTEIFINEIHQSYNCQLLLESILVEHRKFNLIPTLAMHYLSQCTEKCKKSILGSGASFLLISGCDPQAYKDLSVHFDRYGYEESSISELERYHALCLIKNEDKGYSAFVTKLPL